MPTLTTTLCQIYYFNPDRDLASNIGYQAMHSPFSPMLACVPVCLCYHAKSVAVVMLTPSEVEQAGGQACIWIFSLASNILKQHHYKYLLNDVKTGNNHQAW